MTDTSELTRAGARVEQLLDGLTSAADPQARAQAEELVRLLVQLYGAGLARIIEIVTGELDDSTRFAELLIADELVASLLILHGLHPLDPSRRVQAALDNLGDQADGVRLLGIDDGVARLELQLKGCSSGGAALRQRIERAVAEAVPELTAVEVAELARAKAGPQLISVESLFRDRTVTVPR